VIGWSPHPARVGLRWSGRGRRYDSGHGDKPDDAPQVSPTTPSPSNPSAALTPLARARLDELLVELLQRVEDVMNTQDRLRGLLDAVVGIAADLSLDSVLERIVRAACQLADAQYGALGVLGAGPNRRLREFVTHGLTDDQRARIGDLPRGHGILGAIIDRPEPLRLANLGDSSLSYGFPPNHPPMKSFLGVPIRIREKVFGNLYLTEKKSGDGFTADDEEIVVALAAAAGVVVENARLYEDSERRQRWLEAAADVTAALLGESSRDDALQLVADRGREVAGADVAAVMLRHQGGRLLVEAVSGPAPEGLVGTAMPTTDTAAGDVLADGEPVIVDNALGDGRVAASGFLPGDGWPELASLVLLPMGTAGSVAGILAMGWSSHSEQLYQDADLRLPTSFAEQATLALQLAQSQEDRGRLAVFEDRDRIGRDLHDLVIQRLFAIGLALDNASRLTDLPDLAAERIAGAVDDIDATIKDIRRSIFELSTPTASTDVRAELGASIAVIAPALGFTPRLRTDGPVDTVVSAELRPQLLAVVRETLSNVARHAQATSAQVLLKVSDEIVLTVSDDGVGIAAGSRESGLRNMRERAESFGGTFQVQRGPEGGTIAVWRVPVG
jgi:signal transduction histidine kinase